MGQSASVEELCVYRTDVAALYRHFAQFFILQWITTVHTPLYAYHGWLGLLAVTARCHENVHMNEATVQLAALNRGMLFQRYNAALLLTLSTTDVVTTHAITQHLLSSPEWLRRHLFSLLALPNTTHLAQPRPAVCALTDVDVDGDVDGDGDGDGEADADADADEDAASRHTLLTPRLLAASALAPIPAPETALTLL